MRNIAICTNLFTEEPLKRYHNGIRAVNWTKTPIYFPEALSIFPAMIDGSQNAVWYLVLEGEIPKITVSEIRFIKLFAVP